MTDIELQNRLLAACAIAREAGGMAQRNFRDRPPGKPLSLKGAHDYLTETDAEVERLIRARLAAAFPADSFFGEEAGGEFGRNVWVVDPIDGTSNFARGIPHYCISIAFVSDGRTEIGVIYAPVTDELYAARRGRGATRDGRAITVSGETNIAHATVELGWSTRLPSENYADALLRLKQAGASVRRAGSGALALAYVADGRVDAYCELHINSWDALAGLLLIEEAGGWANDFLSGDALRSGNPVLGCTPALKDVLVQATGISPGLSATAAAG
ncbi:inositol monophosphatase family protein [Chelatococcus sp. SYSU_G07232]|uniref:Inositol-1-monophosphatase n=1 Tax=Chelatococcus albus TaxID=3047466 RepID=A0ABT7AJV3_9HYPH|nr:inositol monophosphatase family protein [Chelatococcus sp. SYSU_G07232]MDJ1159657.1 inositol monophosphatase family protein [Chelatococcus sp. SYSU_G07232]